MRAGCGGGGGGAPLIQALTPRLLSVRLDGGGVGAGAPPFLASTAAAGWGPAAGGAAPLFRVALHIVVVNGGGNLALAFPPPLAAAACRLAGQLAHYRRKARRLAAHQTLRQRR